MAYHKKHPENYSGSIEELAEELGNLRYDTLQNFLEVLSQKLAKDGDADFKRGRLKLAKSLYNASEQINNASQSIEQAWKICKPYEDSYEK